MQNLDTSSKPIVAANQLTKQVFAPDGELIILDHVDLEVYAGESIAVLGASGSGKSTLLGLLAGLDLPSKGSVELFGQDLNDLTEDQRALLRSGQVGFVFQSFQLLPGLSALENVMLPLELAGQRDAAVLAQELLHEVGLSQRIQHQPAQLSGGEQQRVAIARAFVSRPKILFADEPTGNLDQATGQKIINLMFDLQKQHNITLLLVTHDPVLAGHCQRHVHLEAGKILDFVY